MADGRDILALDLARKTGWARGRPGERPVSGAVQFGGAGAGHEEVFGGALRWLTNAARPDLIVIEQPMSAHHMRGRTNQKALLLLYGLPAVIGAVANCHRVRVLHAGVQDVRGHFLGDRKMKRAAAKDATVFRCRQLGWMDDTDDNRADALAIWSYACACEAPETAIRPAPLFMARAFDAR